MHLEVTRCVGLHLLLMQAGMVACAADADGSESPRGVTLTGVYSADLLRNTHGGLAVGNAYLDNLDLMLHVDGARALGTPGLRLFAHGLYNNSQRFSQRYPGDAMTASNIDAPRAGRLYEAWADWTLEHRSASVRFGLYDLNSEFDVTDTRGLFLNSSFGVGHDLGQSGVNGPSIFPSTSFAVRVAFEPAAQWTLLAAALDGVPGDPTSASRNTIRLGSEDGALFIAELQRAGTRLTKIAAGAWHYTEQFERLEDVLLQVPSPRQAASSGAYALAQFALWQHAHDARRRLESFVRVGLASDAVHEFDGNAQAGFVLRQPFGAARAESLGIGLSTARTGSAYRRAQRALGAPIEGFETALEITYRRALTSWLTVQPDIQWLMNPGADRSLRDALVLGLRIELSAERSW